MNYLKSIMVAAMLMLAPAAYAQTADQCQTVDQFKASVAEKSGPEIAKKLVTLSGDTLEKFAQNMDRISGGGHSDMDTIVMIDPQQNENDITALAVFNNHCYVGVAMVPTAMVKQALNGLSV